MEIKVEYFIDEDGDNPFQEWYDSLDGDLAKRVFDAVTRMAMGNMSDVKSLRDGVWERRIHSKETPIRIYFGYGNDNKTLVILLAGGTKKRQEKDIKVAKARWQEYISRQSQ